jgi:hypothetical protein
VRADLDTLAIALYVTVDDLLGPRTRSGCPPWLSDTELVCVAGAQVLLGYGSERRWLRFAHQRLGHLFSYLPTSSAYTGGCAAPARWSLWPSKTSRRTPPAGATSCAWSTPPPCPAVGGGRPNL